MNPDPNKPRSARPNGPSGQRSNGGSSSSGPSGREDQEPTVKRRVPPIWLVFTFGLLFYWGQLYLDTEAGGFKAEVFPAWRSEIDLAAAQPKGEGDVMLARGKLLFDARCGLCHQPTGLGGPLAPPLAGSEWVNTPGPGRITRIALFGLGGTIEVKGQPFTGTMPQGLAAGLSVEELAALLSYVRRSWGNNAPAVTPEQVKAIMDKTGSRGPWTADELKAIPEGE